jgi:hypothetical protein
VVTTGAPLCLFKSQGRRCTSASLLWSTTKPAICGTFEEFQRNPLLKLDDTDPASVFSTAQHKLQLKIIKAANTQMSRREADLR